MTDQKDKWVRWPEIAYAASLILLLCMVAFFMKMPRVAVLDTDMACNKLGEEERMSADMKAWRMNARDEVNKLRETFRTQAEDLLAQAEKTTDPAEKDKIRTRLSDLQRTSQETVERIGRELLTRAEKQRQEFRERLQPAIKEVARRHRFDVVMDGRSSAGVMYINARVDVTDEVIEAARKLRTFERAAAPAPAPAAEPEVAEPEPVSPSEPESGV